jgi:hypothetical protein
MQQGCLAFDSLARGRHHWQNSLSGKIIGRYDNIVNQDDKLKHFLQ